MDVSVVIPAYNEARNLEDLLPRVIRALDGLDLKYEIAVVDDGSSDDTVDVLKRFAAGDSRVRAMRLRRNFGKSAALSFGLANTSGDRVILLDADGQDEPNEIPTLLDALDSGCDLVTGRRAQRQDRFIKRRTSRIYNTVTAFITGVHGSDFNSGFKAMRREVASSLDLYGDLHRYIPVLANWRGYSIGEVDVEHHPRLHGESKFGYARFWRGLLDLVTVKFLTTYTARPFHLFGGVGTLVGLAGSALLLWMLVLRLTGHAVGDRPAFLAGVLLVVVSVQLLSLGLLAELLVHHGPARRREPLGEEL